MYNPETMRGFSAATEPTTESSNNGVTPESNPKLEALQTEAKAALANSEWSMAALKFEAILAIVPKSEFARKGLRRVQDHLDGKNSSSDDGVIQERTRNRISVRQLRMYIYVRRAVSRLLRRSRPTDGA